MKIEASDKEIQDIFALGYFRIPRFQRPYSWGDDEVSSFWDDIIKQKSDPYFIGSMVVYQSKKPYFGIVDGQQRLTTITLIFAAIRNAFLKLEEENLAKGIHYYIERPNINNEEEFILNSETSFPYLHNHIQAYSGLNVQCNVGSEEQNLKSAFEFIARKLDSLLPKDTYSLQLKLFENQKAEALSKLKEIRDKILSLKLVFIQLDSEEDAYLIFETLNARGRDLTTADLVKNHLLKKLTSTHVTNDSAKIAWNNIVKRFDDAGFQNVMDSFLYHFWLSSKNYTTEKNLFADLKEHTRDKASAELLLSEFQTNSNYYLSMIAPNNYQWTPEEFKIKQHLLTLVEFGVKQQAPMVLSLIRAYREKKITLKMLAKYLAQIEFFHFVFNTITSQRSTGALHTHYSRQAILLTNAQTHAEVQSILHILSQGLKEKLPSYDEFQANFLELNYTSKRTKNKLIIRYVLRTSLGENPAGLSIDYNSMSIEHLVPEERVNFDFGDDDIGSIGNLLLVDKKTNSEDLSNLSFETKKAILLQKGYPIDEIIVHANEWNVQKIKDRAIYLAKKLYNSSILQ